MDGISIAAAAIGFTTAALYMINLFDEYRKLIVTEEVSHLLTKVDVLRTTLYWTTISIENTLRHASHSFKVDFQYKAFWEDLQRTLVAFKHTAKLFNNGVHRICGKAGHKLFKNYDGLTKLRRMRSSRELFRVLQDRLSFHESCIKLLIDNMTAKIFYGASTPLSLPKKAKHSLLNSLDPTSSQIDRVHQLSDVKKPWLLIVDNTQDLTQAEEYLPSGDKGHILVTTRSSPPGSVDSVHVSGMDTEEKKGFLLWAAGLAMPWQESELAWADEVISQFAPKVNLHTLTHVGATIRNGFCAREEYVALLKAQQTKESTAGILQGSQDLYLEVALTKLRKQKTRSSKDAFILLMASPCFTTRYITLDTLTKSMLPIKTARKEQRLSHYTCFDQSKARAGSRRKIKNFTSKLIRRNGKVRSMP
ncbi:hypothetical protein N7449_006547 [Penicillium cf. viridicatum]|uniref:Fungal N-terminal domain-containing protein n=1 Tax=Penicillium cf. viridicatum TaxID=2972119 RepID=A0A9W9JFR4_9EURO|nr:hypothetical protein N7449_006547 [Penicillium cf. viridicatum]